MDTTVKQHKAHFKSEFEMSMKSDAGFDCSKGYGVRVAGQEKSASSHLITSSSES